MADDSFRLTWVQRDYEYGLDRGVLYLPDGRVVPWNGLISATADPGQEAPQALYIDGQKYMDDQVDGEFSGSLSAYTYPREMDELEGVYEGREGLQIPYQAFERFGLSFRTRTANGYLIHILYNMLAIPGEFTHETVGSSIDPAIFTWQLSGIPVSLVGYKPTEYFILDSERLNSDLLDFYESVLYGSPTQDPSLPEIQTLANFAQLWNPQSITLILSGVHTLSSSVNGDVTPSETSGYWITTPRTRLSPDTVDGLYILE